MVLANAASKGAVKGRIEAGVELADGEVINSLTKLEVRTNQASSCESMLIPTVQRDLFLLSTSNSRVFRLSLSQSSGQPALTLKPFEISTRKIFIASSSSPYLFPPANAGAEGIKSVAVGEAMSPSKGLVKGLGGDATRDVWLLTDTHCQRWTVGAENQKVGSEVTSAGGYADWDIVDTFAVQPFANTGKLDRIHWARVGRRDGTCLVPNERRRCGHSPIVKYRGICVSLRLARVRAMTDH